MPRRQARNWIFTLNNYSDEQVLHLQLLGASDEIRYLVYGYELAPTTGTPHLQGFVSFSRRREFSHVSGLLPQCHLDIARGNASQCRNYCIKGGDFEEFGQPPPDQGKRTDFERYKEWLAEQPSPPSDFSIWEAFPSLYGRYRESLRHIRDLACRVPVPSLGDVELRPWQRELDSRLRREPDDRTIEFIVDYEGNKGKSWYAEYYWVLNQTQCQCLSVGKRDDLAHFINTECRVFFFDVPRGQTEFLRYEVLEALKNRRVFSPKYDSTSKRLKNKCHVIVLLNEDPDQRKLSQDRYLITYI